MYCILFPSTTPQLSFVFATANGAIELLHRKELELPSYFVANFCVTQIVEFLPPLSFLYSVGGLGAAPVNKLKI